MEAETLGLILAVIGFTLTTIVYLIPSIVAISKRLKRAGAIFVLNLFLGWTLLGWVGALVWAVAETERGEE
jgi:cell division protein FtsX